MKYNNEISLSGFESFECLSMDELMLIDGGGFWADVAYGVGYAAGYVAGAVRELAGGMADAAHELNKK